MWNSYLIYFQIEQDFQLRNPTSESFLKSFPTYIEIILKVYAATVCKKIEEIEGTSTIPGGNAH